jgi:hypothetical protein
MRASISPAHRVLAGALVPLAIWATPLTAQNIRVDLLATNRHLWRGLNRTTTWVGQIGASAAAPIGRGAIGIGVFESRELGRSGASDITEVGLGRRGLGERDWWLEYRRPLGSQVFFLGATRYTFHGNAALGGRSSADNTTELALGLQGRLTYLSPTLTAYWDVDRVKGWYLEGTGAVPLLAWPYPPQINVLLDGTVGLDFGEGPRSDDPKELAYYAGNGFTHLTIGATVDLHHGVRFVSSVGARLQVGRDEATKLGAGGRNRSVFATYWLGGTFQLGRP